MPLYIVLIIAQELIRRQPSCKFLSAASIPWVAGSKLPMLINVCRLKYYVAKIPVMFCNSKHNRTVPLNTYSPFIQLNPCSPSLSVSIRLSSFYMELMGFRPIVYTFCMAFVATVSSQ